MMSLEIVFDEHVGYMDVRSDEPKIGALPDLWDDYSDSLMFRLILSLVAEAWQIRPEAVVRSPTWERGRDWLLGEFSRAQLT